MPPNLLFKQAFLGKIDNESCDCEKDKIVRTDFILENTFDYLLKDFYTFGANFDTKNKTEKEILENIKNIITVFKGEHGNAMKIICAEIDEITENTVGDIFLGVSNGLFSGGITWSRILTFFVFVGELTIRFFCIHRKLPKSIVDMIYECFRKLVKEKLESWIDDHNGWEGIKSLFVVDKHKESKASWTKNILHKAIESIGTLASFENIPDNYYNYQNNSVSEHIVIPIIKLEQSVNGDCSICFDKLQANENIIVLSCKHSYHENCIKRWFEQKNICPICRFKVCNSESSDKKS